MEHYLAKIRKIFFSLSALLLFGSALVEAQNSPHPEISFRWGNPDSTSNEEPRKVIASSDGNLVIAGVWQDSAWVKKVSACGSTIWDKRYQIGSLTHFNSMVELPNGNLAVAGVCKNCAVGDSMKKAFIGVINPVGNLFLGYTLGNFNWDAEARDITLLKNGNLAVTGSVVVGTFLNPTDELIAVFSPGLSLVRYNVYDRTYYDEGNRIIATQDSGFAIAGYNHDYLFDTIYATILKCNAAGDTLWMTKETTLDTRFLGLTEAPNGDLVAVGTAYIDTVTGLDGYLRVINGSNGQLGLSQYYGSQGIWDELADIHTLDNGFLVGGRYDYGSLPGYASREWVFHLSPNLVQSDETFREDYLVAYQPQSIVPLTRNGEDWVTVGRFHQFAVKDATFWKHHQKGKEFRFTQFPLDYQLYARDNQNLGTVSIVGTDSATGLQFDSVRVDIFRNDTLITTLQQALTYSSGAATVNLQHPIQAMLANYDIQLYGVEAGIDYPEAEACGVVAGDAFIITGNVGGNAPLMDSTIKDYANPWVRCYALKYENDTVYHWHRERDDANRISGNRSGDVGLMMAHQIVTNHNVPVAILNGGYAAQMIDSMLPTIPHGHYDRFLKQARDAGLQTQIKSLIFTIGEADTYVNSPDSLQSFLAKYTQLRNAWDIDFPNRMHDFISQLRPVDHPLSSSWSSLQIAEAQRVIPDIFPNTSVISTTGLNHDSLYYWFTNGFDRGANDLYRLVDQEVYGAPAAPNSHAPNLDSILFNSSRTEIILYFRNVNNTLTWYPGMESDFILYGAGNVSVVLGYIAGNTAHLVLSGQAPLGIMISHNSHVYGSGCSVKNANGIGMLRFFFRDVDYPVGIDLEKSSSSELHVYPNPVTGGQVHVGIAGMRPGVLALKLFSLEGKCLQIWDIAQTDAYKVHDLDLNVGSGVYLLEVSDNSGNRITTKLVKL